MTRTPDETKKGVDALKMCHDLIVFNPMTGENIDPLFLNEDNRDLYYGIETVLQYIKQLEAQNAELSGKIGQLQAERDAAVGELVGTCQVCRWEETEKCASCHFCEDAWNVHESNWEWRGVQKEE